MFLSDMVGADNIPGNTNTNELDIPTEYFFVSMVIMIIMLVVIIILSCILIDKRKEEKNANSK